MTRDRSPHRAPKTLAPVVVSVENARNEFALLLLGSEGSENRRDVDQAESREERCSRQTGFSLEDEVSKR